jgi:hypothetical protein
LPLECVQELNVAIIKATTSQFHVVPKEKHVRSEWRLSCRCHLTAALNRNSPPALADQPLLPLLLHPILRCSPEAGGAPEPVAAQRAAHHPRAAPPPGGQHRLAGEPACDECWKEALLLSAGWQVANDLQLQQQKQQQQQASLRCFLLLPAAAPSSADCAEDADHAAPADAGERARLHGGAGAVQVRTQAVQAGL